MIDLRELLHASEVRINWDNYKVHFAQRSSLASQNGFEETPLEAFFNGTFQQWQEFQSQQNFGCDHIISLIEIEKHRWLFAGAYYVLDVNEFDSHCVYKTRLEEKCERLRGRVIVNYHKRARNNFRWGDNLSQGLIIDEIRPRHMEVEDFPGFNTVRISYSRLRTIIAQEYKSWHGALSNIKGVYLLTDTSNGKQYVGSATGIDGIWGRWKSYIEVGLDQNTRLKTALHSESTTPDNFQFTILEIADTNTSDDTILNRESHWKDVLQSRQFGYNDN